MGKLRLFGGSQGFVGRGYEPGNTGGDNDEGDPSSSTSFGINL